MKFLRNLLASFLALVIFSLLGLIVVVGVISIMAEDEPVALTSEGILYLNLDKPISEVELQNPLAEVGVISTVPNSIGLVQLKEVIKQAKTDDKIKGIFLNPSGLQAGIATIEEVRGALEDYKESGKFLISYSEYYSEGAYYLASVSDKIYMQPEGDLELNGMSANVVFLKGLFDKLGVEPQIFRVGEFKSAVEPFIRKDMSEASRLQTTSMLTSLNDFMLSNISKSRSIPLSKLKEISNLMEARSPKTAVELKLIDELAYYDAVEKDMMSKVEVKEGEKLPLISYSKYKKSFNNYVSSDNEVAVIVASGEIHGGEGDLKTIGSKTFCKEIKKARNDDEIKAVVIRINSPGGSFVASDVMWREIKLTSEKKPVIASMSDMAASGGYYMSMACDSIVAQPNTITGSIGIFGMIFNFKQFLNDKLGVTSEEVNTGEFSGMHTASRPLTEQEKAIIQKDVEEGYETFVTKAAEGRGMSVEAIKDVASGRVWTGAQAKERGLVDVLGTFDDAIVLAAKAAKIEDDYKVRYYPKQRSVFEQFFKDLEEETKTKALKSELGEFYPYFNAVQKVKKVHGVQARMPYDLYLD